ncbi:MAG: replication-associated recombination protein A [Dehalococcoidia bacterium]|jgi:putative ATPase
MDMFEHSAKEELSKVAPLAARMRPKTFGDFIGQKKIIGSDSILRRNLNNGNVPSMILWGPPGSGKTTLANLISNSSKMALEKLSAVTSGVSEIKAAIKEAENRLGMNQKRTILFIDEIHRLNKSQQDVVLPYVENGIITLIGATTENPSFEVIAPLLSRSQVFKLNQLDSANIKELLEKAIIDTENGLGGNEIFLEPKTLEIIAEMSSGDARWAYNVLELCFNSTYTVGKVTKIDKETVYQIIQNKKIGYDKKGDYHYDTISAFIKSIRLSDANAAIYWLARMLDAGEDPMFIARRIIISASEDIGLADPMALNIAVSAQQALHVLGLPEGRIPLAEATIYLAKAPKSNSAYEAINLALTEIRASGIKPVPLHLRNPVTNLMEKEGYGKGYKNPHKSNEPITLNNMPDGLNTEKFYKPDQ